MSRGSRGRRVGGLLVGVAALGIVACGGASRTGRLPLGARPVKPAGHLARVNCLAFSPDGRRLVSGSDDNTLLIWEVESGEIVQRLEGHRAFVSACAFLPGDRVVSGGWGGEVFVWDAATGTVLRRLEGLPEVHVVYALGASEDGREVLAGTHVGRVMGWNPDTGVETFAPNNALAGAPNQSTVRTAGFTSDGRRFAGGEVGKTLVWGPSTTSVEVLASSGVALPGDRLALGRWAGVTITAAGKSVRTLEGHEGWVDGLAASPAGDRLLAADEHGHARVWHVATGTAQCSLDAPSGYRAAAWAPTGERVAVAGDDGQIRLGEVPLCAGGKDLPVRALGTARGRVGAVAAGATALLGDSKGRVSEWDPATWRIARSTPAHAGEVMSIALLPDGRWVSGGVDRGVVLGGAGTSRKLVDLQNQVRALAILPNAGAVLAGDDTGGVTEISLVDGSKAVRWTAPDSVGDLALEPAGAAVLAGGVWFTVVRLPLSPNGDRTEWPSETSSEGTRALRFLPDGRFVQGSTGGDVLVRRGETVEKRLTGLTDEVSGLVVEGPHLWAGGSARALVRWTLDGALAPDVRIDEGAKIQGLATTSNGFLLAGLADGRASVRRLPDGALVAHLYPFADGSGATILADGTYFATAGDAYALRLEDPATRRVVTLGDLLQPRMTTPQVTPLPDGSVAVRATVFSPSGPPSVTLDDGWTIEAVTPSQTALLAYDIDLQLREPRGGRHTLTAAPPEGASVKSPFTVLPDPRLSPGKARALVIGNSAYEQRPRLPGAEKDAALVRAFLESADGWQLTADRISAPPGLKARPASGPTLLGAITDFFARAEADETLFFYFSGHGESDTTQGYLLPLDAPVNSRAGAVSAQDLWGAIRDSKAARIIVILDACRAGAFVIPTDLALQNKAVLLAATEPGGTARDFASGGAFTTALIGAMHDPDAIDSDDLAVTARAAYFAVGRDPNAQRQTPMMFGMGSILRLPLSWPAPKKLDRRAASDSGAVQDSGLRQAKGDLVAVTYPGEKGSSAVLERNGKLELRVVFERPTQALKISAYQPVEGYRATPRAAPSPVRIEVAPGNGAWPEGQEKVFSLFDLKTDQTGFIEVRTCSADGKTCKLPQVLKLPSPGAASP